MIKVFGISSSEYTFGETDPVLQAIQKHATDVQNILGIVHSVAITVFPQAGWTIPESGDTGFTPTQDWVQLTLDLTGKKFSLNTIIEKRVKPLVYHELNHAQRHMRPGFGFSLHEHLITEGLASVFEQEHCEYDVLPYFESTPEEIERYKTLYQKHNPKAYTYQSWFTNAAPALPQYIGYKLGHAIVKKYREEHRSMSWSDLVHVAAEDIPIE